MEYTIKRFSEQNTLEEVYKNILNPIILLSDKAYGAKKIYDKNKE